MPNTEISALAALLGAALADGDLFVAVDVSDTSMAATGTDKKISYAELKAALATVFEAAGAAGAAVDAHELLVNPHPDYLTPVEGDAAYEPLGAVADEVTARDAAIAQAVADLLDGAPGALDTLNELAAAFGDDANFITTVTNALAGKQPINSNLTAIALLTTTAFGRALLELADAAAARAAISAVGLTGNEAVAGVKTFLSDPLIPDEAYDATAWNGSLEPATKNAIRDKIETMRPPYVQDYDGTGAGVSDSNVETSLLASTTAFPTVAVGDVVVIEGSFTWMNQTGAGQTLTIKVKVGGAGMANVVTGSVASNAMQHKVNYRVVLIIRAIGTLAGAGRVALAGIVAVSTATSSNFDSLQAAASTLWVGGGTAACATDGAGDVVDVTAQMSTATAGGQVNNCTHSVRHYPKLV